MRTACSYAASDFDLDRRAARQGMNAPSAPNRLRRESLSDEIRLDGCRFRDEMNLSSRSTSDWTISGDPRWSQEAGSECFRANRAKRIDERYAGKSQSGRRSCLPWNAPIADTELVRPADTRFEQSRSLADDRPLWSTSKRMTADDPSAEQSSEGSLQSGFPGHSCRSPSSARRSPFLPGIKCLHLARTARHQSNMQAFGA